MNLFLRPTTSKVLITLAILLVVFGGNLLYSLSFTPIENGVQPPNLFITIIHQIGNVIYYPVHLIIILIPIKTNITTYQNNFLALLLVSILSIVLTILESYLIGCAASMVIKKK